MLGVAVTIPRIVTGDMRNPNGQIYEKESFNRALNWYVTNIGLCSLYIERPISDYISENLSIRPEDVIGRIIQYNDDAITVSIQEEKYNLFKTVRTPYISFKAIGHEDIKTGLYIIDYIANIYIVNISSFVPNYIPRIQYQGSF